MQKDIDSICSLASAVAHILGIEPPSLAVSPVPAPVLRETSIVLNGRAAERCLIFAPDAIGKHLASVCENEFSAIRRICKVEIPVQSVMPSKTPVCFASMFSGAKPQVHGIRHYQKPVLQCDTLFDALIRSGRVPAIVAVRESSMDIIFRGREMDYYSEGHDSDTTIRTMELMLENRCDVIVCYQQEYDDILHRTQPFSKEALSAVKRHVNSFCELALSAREAWRGKSYALVFAPDHGAHIDPDTGNGTHGDDIPEDMELFHWYKISSSHVAPE